MRSISSHLFELNRDHVAKSKVTDDTIKVRYWFNKKIKIRESEFGPIISDAPFLSHLNREIAIQWLGHQTSNELKSFLLANKASNFKEFRKAFQSYAVSGQSLVYADKNGNIGLIPAYTQPVLKDPAKTLELVKNSNNQIVEEIDSYDLPFSYNPVSGFIASANNLPYESEIPISFDHSGYNRMERMIEMFESNDSISMKMLVEMQTDVVSNEAIAIKQLIIDSLGTGLELLMEKYPEHMGFFLDWKGNYDVDSKGAAVFEILMYYLVSDYLTDYYPQDYMKDYFMGENRWQLLLPRLIKQENSAKLNERFFSAFRQSKRDLKKYPTWGDMHRLIFGTLIAPVPIIGNSFRMAEQGIGGTSNTLMKTAHSFTPKKHSISYGSNSRHISNMADPDENYFVLLGGQDGWIKSPHNHDQLKLWNKKEYIKIPLRLESIQKEFTYHISEIK